jgi:hypothetical protein
MPKSRKRSNQKRRGFQRTQKRLLDIADFFDQLVRERVQISPYPALYHYTSLASALAILESQRFWSTAHDCTNDPAELVTANSIVVDEARRLREIYTSGTPAKVLDAFIEHYPSSAISLKRTIFLSCFSIPRDEPHQWNEYGDFGRGICLGIRVLEEPGPTNPDTVSALVEVDYSEGALRDWLAETFDQICSVLAKGAFSRHNCEEGLSAFYRIAAFASIRAKHAEWKSEQEVRHVTFARRETDVKPHERISAAGEIIRYLPVSLRAGRKIIALDEIIIGPNCVSPGVREQLEILLAEKGYTAASVEYPRITSSKVPKLSSNELSAPTASKLHDIG